jgi:hypothetical protein
MPNESKAINWAEVRERLAELVSTLHGATLYHDRACRKLFADIDALGIVGHIAIDEELAAKAAKRTIDHYRERVEAAEAMASYKSAVMWRDFCFKARGERDDQNVRAERAEKQADAAERKLVEKKAEMLEVARAHDEMLLRLASNESLADANQAAADTLDRLKKGEAIDGQVLMTRRAQLAYVADRDALTAKEATP